MKTDEHRRDMEIFSEIKRLQHRYSLLSDVNYGFKMSAVNNTWNL